MSEETHPTLTIKDLTESDKKFYCYLQVKVIPATEGQTVSLICNTSCPLTENPAAYIWYKNREFLYQDWSPWYQQLVSSEEAVRYSCAVKGYEHLRAPEVSVEVSLQSTPAYGDYATLTCNTSCPLADKKTAYRWYKNINVMKVEKKQQLSVSRYSPDIFSCAVKDHEDLHSAEVCLEVKLHPAVVTEGQRVTLTCSTSCPLTDNTNYIWYLNSQRLTEPESQNKHLLLDPVTIQHAGNYSCAVKTHQNIISGEKTLTVQSITGTSTAAAAGVVAALLEKEVLQTFS
ncbi:B-cell receptor CD22-like [Scomber scombrus]|uniref:B-cell receptor CD22-like n=1 Tax=Scomber scombrus TaxID=13677 RepID=UPI002DDBACBD|nr:B-cell receptor CD22-like [Scomber scombrus]